MLLQSEAPALDDRISEPHGVRNADGISLGGFQPNRVQANKPLRRLLKQIAEDVQEEKHTLN